MDNLMLFVTLSAILFCLAGAILSPIQAVITKSDLDEFYQVVGNDAILSDKFNFIMEKMPSTYVDEIVRFGAVLGYHFTIEDVKNSISEQGNYVCLPLGCWYNLPNQTTNYVV